MLKRKRALLTSNPACFFYEYWFRYSNWTGNHFYYYKCFHRNHSHKPSAQNRDPKRSKSLLYPANNTKKFVKVRDKKWIKIHVITIPDRKTMKIKKQIQSVHLPRCSLDLFAKYFFSSSSLPKQQAILIYRSQIPNYKISWLIQVFQNNPSLLSILKFPSLFDNLKIMIFFKRNQSSSLL